ncbi:MAG: PKD domain-containing protein [Candidatus Thermoplasmatota archaeon]|nr:PKD domain-containing protein [Candidatus Thermoplasmatota archaeon]
MATPTLGAAGVPAHEQPPIEAPPIVPGTDYEYRNFTTIRSTIYEVESNHSDIVEVHDIGDSWEKTQGLADRDILAVKISDNVLVDEDEPEVLILALHHAREWVSSELITEAIINITSSYGKDIRTSWLVDNRELWIVPVVNPDGLDYSLTADSMWRKNRRLNYDGSYGVDLNRNYNGSENGDPAGAWGGAGSSHTPSDITYCGEAPFSEPETIAIRDLTCSHDFAIELDFHSYGELVMWPWGYTFDKTAADSSLVSIGNQLAAINGYLAAQAIELYPTTGDSLDWLYGGADVYPFLFEIGRSFQPTKAIDVWAIIDENLPAIFLGIELAGDRDLSDFEIHHSPVSTRPWSVTGHTIDAVITAGRGVNPSSTALVYRADGGQWTTISMNRTDNDTYTAVVPRQPAGAMVEYYFTARDLGGIGKMSPAYSPYEMHSYTVTPVSAPPDADAGLDQDVPLGALVVFDGSGSSDDLGVVNYTWTFTYDGREEVLYGVGPHFAFELPGVYEVTLTVCDDEGQSDSDTMVISIVEIPEIKPIAVLVVAVLMIVLFAARAGVRRRPDRG